MGEKEVIRTVEKYIASSYLTALCVLSGSVVAVVGGSGSGKSSVVALLLRLYDPQCGAITLDGADITSLDPASLRAAIGVVSQVRGSVL